MGTRSQTGITWNHTRGSLPLVAAAQRFTDPDPGAIDFARFIAVLVCQRGLSARDGGQPGHRGAWLDSREPSQ